jgi:hypothetical protein
VTQIERNFALRRFLKMSLHHTVSQPGPARGSVLRRVFRASVTPLMRRAEDALLSAPEIPAPTISGAPEASVLRRPQSRYVATPGVGLAALLDLEPTKSSVPQRLAHIWRDLLSRLHRDRSGVVAVATTLSMTALLGIAGLSTDVGVWYASKRTVQSAADSAALAGALETLRTGEVATVVQAAERDAIINGFDATAGDIIRVNRPPLSGPNMGDATAVEVVIEHPAPLFFAKFFLDAPVTVASRAVAVADINDTCVWGLDRSARAAVEVSGSAQVAIACGIMVNSDDAEALTQDGSSCLTATRIKVVGSYNGDCVAPNPKTGAAPASDPLETLAPPDHGGCDHPGKVVVAGGSSATLSPGVYCGGISIVSDSTVTFESGLYVLDGGGLSIGAQATATGADVSFFLTQNSGTNDNVSIQAGGTVSLSAPTIGYFPNGNGILFFHDRNSPSNVTHDLTGGSTAHLDGIIYFPNQDLNYSGGATHADSPVMIIARSVSFSGNSRLGDYDGSAVETNPLLVEAKLVE